MERRAFLKATLGATALVALAPIALAAKDTPRVIYLENSLYISLYTTKGMPWDPPNMIEADYKDYARVEAPRDFDHWKIKKTRARNAKQIIFPECTGGQDTITHAGIHLGPEMVYCVPLDVSLTISEGIKPIFDIGSLVIDGNQF